MRIQLLHVKSLEQCLVGSKCCVNYRFVNLDGLEQGSNRIYGCQGRVQGGSRETISQEAIAMIPAKDPDGSC